MYLDRFMTRKPHIKLVGARNTRLSRIPWEITGPNQERAKWQDGAKPSGRVKDNANKYHTQVALTSLPADSNCFLYRKSWRARANESRVQGFLMTLHSKVGLGWGTIPNSPAFSCQLVPLPLALQTGWWASLLPNRTRLKGFHPHNLPQTQENKSFLISEMSSKSHPQLLRGT